MNDKIIERIKKLFALGSNNPNENEAKSAMRMARKLLDKHNLSMYDLKQEDEVGIKLEDYKNVPWVRIVYDSISRLYDCKHLIDKAAKPNKHLIIGREGNRITASIVIHYILKEIEWHGAGMGSGFRNAAAFEIREIVNKILAERNASKEEVMLGTGLVPMDIYLKSLQDNEDWINSHLGGYNKATKTSVRVNSEGIAVGKNINLGARLSNKIAIEN